MGGFATWYGGGAVRENGRGHNGNGRDGNGHNSEGLDSQGHNDSKGQNGNRDRRPRAGQVAKNGHAPAATRSQCLLTSASPLPVVRVTSRDAAARRCGCGETWRL